MFERFTARARQAMELATQKAKELGHDYVATEHILLGLLAVDKQHGSWGNTEHLDLKEGVVLLALGRLGIDTAALEKTVRQKLPNGPGSTINPPPQTPRAKKAIEYAIEEARAMGDNFIATEHLLLGIIRENEGTAAQALIKAGARIEPTREAVVQILSGQNHAVVGLNQAAAGLGTPLRLAPDFFALRLSPDRREKFHAYVLKHGNPSMAVDANRLGGIMKQLPLCTTEYFKLMPELLKIWLVTNAYASAKPFEAFLTMLPPSLAAHLFPRLGDRLSPDALSTLLRDLEIIPPPPPGRPYPGKGQLQR